MNALIDKNELSADEQDLLTLLGTLVIVYEEEHFPDEAFELRGVELLKALLAEQGLRQKDLVLVFKTESIVSAVLNGRRPFTVEHIAKLSQFFQLSPELFFEDAYASKGGYAPPRTQYLHEEKTDYEP